MAGSSFLRLINSYSFFEIQLGCHFLHEVFSHTWSELFALQVSTATGFLPSSQLFTSHASCGYNCLYPPLNSKQCESKDYILSILWHTEDTEQVFSKHSWNESTCSYWAIFFLGHFAYIMSFNLSNDKFNPVLLYRNWSILGAFFKY